MLRNKLFNRTVASLVALSVFFFSPVWLEAVMTRPADQLAPMPAKKGLSRKGTFVLGCAVGAGAVIAAPFIAGAVTSAGAGAAVGAAAAGIGGVVAGGAGLIAGTGAALWGAVSAAGGCILGALGAVGSAIGGALAGIAGFIGGIIGSPIFIPALIILGVAAVAFYLWKKRKRQDPGLSNGGDLPYNPGTGVSIGTTPSAEVGTGCPGYSDPSPEVYTDPNTPYASTDDMTLNGGADAAHQKYIDAYNRYIKIVTSVQNSENLDEDMKENMRSADAQRALQEYREAYYNWQKAKAASGQ